MHIRSDKPLEREKISSIASATPQYVMVLAIAAPFPPNLGTRASRRPTERTAPTSWTPDRSPVLPMLMRPAPRTLEMAVPTVPASSTCVMPTLAAKSNP